MIGKQVPFLNGCPRRFTLLPAPLSKRLAHGKVARRRQKTVILRSTNSKTVILAIGVQEEKNNKGEDKNLPDVAGNSPTNTKNVSL